MARARAGRELGCGFTPGLNPGSRIRGSRLRLSDEHGGPVACLGPDPAPSPWGFVSGVGPQTGREVGGGQGVDLEGGSRVQGLSGVRTERDREGGGGAWRRWQGRGVGGGVRCGLGGAQRWLSAAESVATARTGCTVSVAVCVPSSASVNGQRDLGVVRQQRGATARASATSRSVMTRALSRCCAALSRRPAVPRSHARPGFLPGVVQAQGTNRQSRQRQKAEQQNEWSPAKVRPESQRHEHLTSIPELAHCGLLVGSVRAAWQRAFRRFWRRSRSAPCR